MTAKDRRFIKGRKYTLLSNRANLTLDGRRSLAKLLQANQRLNIAYLLLREFFSQLWNYQREAWARRCLENWKHAPKGQRLKPYEKFARMIDQRFSLPTTEQGLARAVWEGLRACRPPPDLPPLRQIRFGFT